MDDIEVDLRLTVVKPLHAQWLVDMYNYFNTAPGKEVIIKGWKKAEILECWMEQWNCYQRIRSKLFMKNKKSLEQFMKH